MQVAVSDVSYQRHMSAPSSLRVVPLDLSHPDVATIFLDLLDHYACDPMGGGTGLSPAARNELVPRLLARNDFVGFLAFAGEEPIGLIDCFEGFSTFAARPLLNVHDLVVRRDHRGRGIAQALLDAAANEARRRDCCKLTLEVLSNNRPAMLAYERAGFSPYELDPAAGQALLLQKWL